MHAEDIKAAIRKNGVTPAQIARDNGVTKMAVSHVLHGNSKSARLAVAIAKAAQKPVAEIWPGKYPALAFAEKLASKKSAAQIEAELGNMRTRRAAQGRKAVAA